MPKVNTAWPIVVGFRTTEAGQQKLDELARRLRRPRADVLRLLVAMAQPSDLPGVRFVAERDGVPVGVELDGD
jgi:hypothetical protein